MCLGKGEKSVKILKKHDHSSGHFGDQSVENSQFIGLFGGKKIVEKCV